MFCKISSLPILRGGPVAALIPAVATSITGPTGAAATAAGRASWASSSPSASSSSSVDPPVLSLHARTLA